MGDGLDGTIFLISDKIVATGTKKFVKIPKLAIILRLLINEVVPIPRNEHTEDKDWNMAYGY